MVFLHGYGDLHKNILPSSGAGCSIETDVGAREKLPAPVLFNIPMLPPSVGQASAAASTTASQDLTAVGGSHASAETMDLGAMTLLGLIGTNHAGTPPVQIGGIFRLHNAPEQGAVGK